MTIETTVNKHRGVLLIAIGGFLVFLYIRHKRQQAAAAAAQAAAAAAAAQDPGTMDQATYNKQFSQPAPAYLGSPFSGYGANAPNFPPPAQPAQPATPSPPITFPNPAASSSDSTVGAATGGGAPSSQATGYPSQEQLAGVLAGRGGYALPIGPDGKPATGGPGYFVPNNMTIEQITGGAPNPNMASYQANSGFSPQQFQQIGFTLQTDPAGNQFYAAPPGSPAPNIG